ncbi:GNAT family N-acetyltransferase [Azohydromonas caseinilytica]|uniref:GNAT family N-acetyltransferase n=1 Tax=Azohydromonas caseinilytica TaxID=2728836 RepID=A0A848FF16_9BURK|nr:GNAT family N-acetyltransferase [Azohydromonas caseinilytica]NML16919.1 GNAT family N-acetyltransferase [Azohydromonas caseinilytica]
MTHLLDNIIWHALSGTQRRYSVGTDRARRYSPGFSPIAGFIDPSQPDFNALRSYCEPGEHFYCDGWSGPAPPSWQIEAETTMFRMVWEGALPADDDFPQAIPLESEHALQALELATLTRPGPFGPRTIELGDYFGIFDNGHLVAMAGERMAAQTLREVSGVCTHPDYQGRGWARRLMLKLIRRQLQRGETPFLHVMSENHGAHRLYQRMGFRDYKESVVRVVAPD